MRLKTSRKKIDSKLPLLQNLKKDIMDIIIMDSKEMKKIQKKNMDVKDFKRKLKKNQKDVQDFKRKLKKNQEDVQEEETSTHLEDYKDNFQTSYKD